MGLPGSSLALAALVIVALPGFISAGIRRWARGEFAEDRMPALSLARGATFAVVLTSIYLIIFGGYLYESLRAGRGADTIAINDPRRMALTVILFYVVVPTVAGLLMNSRHIKWRAPPKLADNSLVKWVRVPYSKHGYGSTPTSWEHAVTRNDQSWVKILCSDGLWVGGWYTKGSFTTTYPEPHSIYIDRQFAMSDEGEAVS